jgi:hypothetical protein
VHRVHAGALFLCFCLRVKADGTASKAREDSFIGVDLGQDRLAQPVLRQEQLSFVSSTELGKLEGSGSGRVCGGWGLRGVGGKVEPGARALGVSHSRGQAGGRGGGDGASH